MNKAMAIVALSVAVPLVCFPAQAKTPKALMVMVDGLRADAVENLPMPTLLMLRDGKWRPDYRGCYSWTAHTFYDARPSSAQKSRVSLTGDIDDFALWTRSLTHEEIRRIYESGQKGLSLGEICAGAGKNAAPSKSQR